MPTDPRRTLGSLGERIAEQHLLNAGYEIVERNFRTQHGELDLIAADARCLVFCEVKTRIAGGGSGPAGPLDAVGPAKRRRLRLMAFRFLNAREPGQDRPGRGELRFDAIGVTVSPSGELLALDHVENAF
jgi:putative endonuclease